MYLDAPPPGQSPPKREVSAEEGTRDIARR